MIDEPDVVHPGSIVRRGFSPGFWYYGRDEQYHGPFDDEHEARAACAATGVNPDPSVSTTGGEP